MSKRDRYAQQLGEEPASSDMPTIQDIYPLTPPIPPRRSASGLALKDGEVQIGSFTLTGKGLQISSSATRDEWHKVGDLLFRLQGSIQWLIGDWLAYGEDVKWGDVPKLSKELGKAEQTLHDYTSVARRVQFSFRKENLSYTHHAVAANSDLTPEQLEYALEHAAKNDLSVSKFRQWIKKQKGELEMPSLPQGDQLNTDVISRDMQKFWQFDPTTAKPQAHERAREIAIEAQNAVDAFKRKWGIK